MKIFFLMLLAALVFGCSDSKPEDTELKISYVLPEGRTCQTYLADYFEVTWYDSEQRKIGAKEIPCDSESADSLTLLVSKGSYYVSVVLLDKSKMWRSYGAAQVEVNNDTEVTVNMETYLGGMIFLWNPSDCSSSKYNLAMISLDLFSEGEPVKAVIWGEETELRNFAIPCKAGRFEVINVPADPLYTAKLNGYRTKSFAGESRVVYEIPEFVSGHGQNISIDIDSYKQILVSDMKLSWEFDSKSITSCETAGVTKVVASLVSEEATVSVEHECDNKFADFYLYDIPEHEYTLYLYGISGDDETLFESSLEIGMIEAGSIGRDMLENKIFLKEK
ncbi:hypothetical protein IKO70_08290 [bacterium]|jgi:hypothetical protein|nr:hypothetical protein [bacterium]